MLAEIQQLLELQTIDGQHHELSVQIERLRAQRRQVEQRITRERAQVDRLRERLAELEHESRMKNLEVDELDDNIRRYQERLDTGIISFKEMEDLGTKIASERGRMSAMEDEALTLMDTIEESKQALEDAITTCASKVAVYEAQIEEISRRLEDTRQDVEQLDRQRADLRERIPDYLIGQYDTLHQRSSQPVATVHNGTCSGCKLRLSASTVERVRGATGIVTCEHCSRILYIDDFDGHG